MPLNRQIEKARALWQLGAWEALSTLTDPNRQDLSGESPLYLAASLYQLGQIEQAKSLLLELDLNPAQKDLMAELLISGAYNALGRAHACSNNYEHAENLCKKALSVVSNDDISFAFLNARVTEQFSQLGIPRLAENISPSAFKPDVEKHLLSSNQYFSQEPAQQIAMAEFYQLNDRCNKAIVHWQNVSSLLNADMPQFYYDRLRNAYKSSRGFPPGTVEQEVLRGDTDKHQLLSEIHEQLKPEFYFEVGVQSGKSLALAKCEALGIDPMPMLNQELPVTAKVIAISSDAFFMRQSDLLLCKSIDLSFIDGMHLFEYVLRDFINVEKYAKPHSLIVIDDIFPGHPDQAKRDRCTRAWTGDVWKLKKVLDKYRPDLFILAVDAYPTGLLLISALNAECTILQDNYQAILAEYDENAPVPEDIMRRAGSVSGKAAVINQLMSILKLAGQQQAGASLIRNNLAQIS